MKSVQAEAELEPDFLSMDGAEKRTSISRWTWRKYCYEGKVASVKVGKRLLIPVAEINRIMQAGLRPAVETKRK